MRPLGLQWELPSLAVEVGEQVHAKFVGPRGRQGKNAFFARSAVESIWLGVWKHGEQNIVNFVNGKVLKARTIHRKLLEERWDVEQVFGINVSFAAVDLGGKKQPDVLEFIEDNADEFAPGMGTLGGFIEKEVGASKPFTPRRFMLRQAVFEKHCYTFVCCACGAQGPGLPHSGSVCHIEACGPRLEAAIAPTFGGQDAITSACERIAAHTERRWPRAPHSKQPLVLIL